MARAWRIEETQAMKQRMVLILSIVVGLLAFWLTRQYLQVRGREIEKVRQDLYAGIKQVYVIAAKRDLAGGTVLEKKDLIQKLSLERDVSRNTVLPDDVEQIIGKKLKNGLEKEETLLWTYVDVPFRPGGGLAPMVNPTMRAVSVAIGGAAAVSGLVQPNDHVDVLGSFYFPSKAKSGEMEAVTLTILQDVTVLATGPQLGKALESGERSRASTGYSTVTFEVTPREAELLVFVESMKGHLTLTLRNPADGSYQTSLPTVDFNLLEQEIPTLNAYRQETIRHKGSADVSAHPQR
jgi:pilus assembly protein CpaB